VDAQRCITELESEYGIRSWKKGPEILQVQQGDTNWFEFDAVIGHRSKQKDVYVRSGAYRSVTEDIFKGYNVTFLAYGQTVLEKHSPWEPLAMRTKMRVSLPGLSRSL
jgi:hypothetical protein